MTGHHPNQTAPSAVQREVHPHTTTIYHIHQGDLSNHLNMPICIPRTNSNSQREHAPLYANHI